MNSRVNPQAGRKTKRTSSASHGRDDVGETAAEHVPGIAESAWVAHVAESTELFDRLVSRHRERQRRYHRIEHVEAVITHLDELVDQEPVDDLGVVVAAALYHDAVYEPQHPNNERASARLAVRDLGAVGWETDRARRVADLIEGTKTHLDPPDSAAAVLFDADLAILGAEPSAYSRYVAAVRDEYSHLDDSEWAAGRFDAMSAFVERDSIYATATGRARWEAAARTNITNELATLQGPSARD